MGTTENPGRNDACPCGSGKKYKRCCEGVEPTDSVRVWTRALGVVVVVALVIGGVGFARNAVIAQEEGAVDEPRRVWSAEHGHWHVAGGGEDGSGVAPPGKVWHKEHGHWHDAPALTRSTPRASGLDEKLLADAEALEAEINTAE